MAEKDNQEFVSALLRNESQALAFRSLRDLVTAAKRNKKYGRDELLDLLASLERTTIEKLKPIMQFLTKE